MKMKFIGPNHADGYDGLDYVDLVHGREYEVLGEEKDFLRVVDESGEDYLYPRKWFIK